MKSLTELNETLYHISEALGSKRRESGTPQQAYSQAEKKIDDSLKAINKKWSDLKKGYKKQLKDKPESWAGIGRGSELEQLRHDVDQLKNDLDRFVV